MKYLIPVLLLLVFTAAAYAQEEEPPKDGPEEPAAPALELSPQEISRQITLLGSRFMTDRIGAQSTIARAGESVIPHLKKLLQTENPLLRMNVVELLGRMKQPDAIRPIIEMFGDSSPAVRSSAKRALGYYGPEILLELQRLTESGQMKESDLPGELIAKLYRKPLVELFGKVVQGGQYPGQYAAIAALGPKAIPALLSLLDECLAGARDVAGGAPAVLGALSEFTTKDKRVIDKLERLWNTPEASYLRQPVAITLAKLGAETHLNEMIDALLDSAKTQTDANLFAQVLLYHRVGKYDESQKWFRRAAEAAGQSGYIHHYNLACALAMGKNPDAAVDALKTAIKNGYQNFSWMVKDKELDPIRQNAGYIELIKKHCPQHLPEKLKEKKEEEKQAPPKEPEKDSGSDE